MDFIRLNISLKVPDEVSKKAISLSKEIAINNKPMFVLDEVGFYPHITVYPPEYPDEELENVFSKVKEIANETEQMTIKFNSPKSLEGFVAVSIELSAEIEELHEKIVKALNPLRGGHIKQGYEDYTGFSREQYENVQRHGYPNVMNLYDPHLTIIRLENEDVAKDIADSLQWDVDESIIEKLAVYTMGENGTCKELLQEFSLK